MPNFPAFPTLGIGKYGPVAPGSASQPKPAVLTAKFGGRYSQRTGDGINALPRDFSFKSTVLPLAKAKQLEDFLVGRKGYQPFTFLVPGEVTPRQFTCEKFELGYQGQIHAVLTAQFEENFDP